MIGAIKWWVHVVGVAALYGLFAPAVPRGLRVAAWLGVAGYALAWWAGLDEFLKQKSAEEGALVPTGVSAAWPVGAVLMVGGGLAALLRTSTGLGIAALGIAILLIGYFSGRRHV